MSVPLAPASELLFIKSDRLAHLAKQCPVNEDRAALLYSLLATTGLLDIPGVHVEEGRPATIEELRQYHHLADNLAALANYHHFSPSALSRYGLDNDCAPFPGLFEHACLCVGGSLQAAAALCARRCRIAVHLDGGRHHARRAAALGFCYLNDCVLATLRLLGSFKRVLYLDVDVHHGDAVEEAFAGTDRVLTISLHHRSPGFFPGTGAPGAAGQGGGRGFALNLPLGEGLKDALFVRVFAAAAGGAVEMYCPECVVLQCGVDGLAHDPVGRSWSLTPRAYAAAAAAAARWGVPLMVVGGGGYHSPSAACAWTAVMAALLGKALPEDVPEHEFLDRYGPSFSLSDPGRPALSPDSNSEEAVDAGCGLLLRQLRQAVGEREEHRRLAGAGGAVGHVKRMKT